MDSTESDLQLEQKLGTRPCTSGLPGVDIPFLNNLCVKLASQWPPVNDLNIGPAPTGLIYLPANIRSSRRGDRS